MKSKEEILEARGHFYVIPRPYDHKNVMAAMQEYADQYKELLRKVMLTLNRVDLADWFNNKGNFTPEEIQILKQLEADI